MVEIPRLLWWPILHGVILRLRPRKSAAKYASIWTERARRCWCIRKQQAVLLRGYLGDRGIDADVVLAMRYGDPSIGSALRTLAERRTERVLIVPMYPQYSATTTASALDAVFDVLGRTRNVPEVRWVKHFHDDPGYIAALRQSVLDHWKRHGRAQDRGGKLVMSFHGVPKRTLRLGDPYHCECQKTGRLLAESLGLGAGQYVLTFQSRFGRAEWLQPYTAPTLEALARGRAGRSRRHLPGVSRRLPRDAGGDRDRRARHVHRGRRQGVPLHPMPERLAGIHFGAGRSVRSAHAGLAGGASRYCRANRRGRAELRARARWEQTGRDRRSRLAAVSVVPTQCVRTPADAMTARCR